MNSPEMLKPCASNVSVIGSALTFEGEMSATMLNNTKPTILVTDIELILATIELVTFYLLLALRMG